VWLFEDIQGGKGKGIKIFGDERPGKLLIGRYVRRRGSFSDVNAERYWVLVTAA
jgi:hypothetical protein